MRRRSLKAITLPRRQTGRMGDKREITSFIWVQGKEYELTPETWKSETALKFCVFVFCPTFHFFPVKRQGLIKLGAFLIFLLLLSGRGFLFQGRNATTPYAPTPTCWTLGKPTAPHQNTPPLITKQTIVIKNIKLIVSPPRRMCPPRLPEIRLED